MLHRRGGKRIRMDDPVPPEYETPMTPMTPMNDNSGGDANDYNAYTPTYQASQTPLRNPTCVSSFIENNVIHHLFIKHDCNILLYICSPEHYYSESYSSPSTSQQQYQEQNNFDNQAQFEAPMTPATPNMRITRNTRARMRGIYKYIFLYMYNKIMWKMFWRVI